MMLESRLRAQEARARHLENRPSSGCRDCQRLLNRVEDLRSFAINLETTKTGLAVRVGELHSELLHAQTRFTSQEQELKAARNRIAELEDQNKELKHHAAELKKRVDALEQVQVPDNRLTRAQAKHVYEFCWTNSAALGDPRRWWELVRACALNDQRSLQPTQFMVAAASSSAPSTPVLALNQIPDAFDGFPAARARSIRSVDEAREDALLEVSLAGTGPRKVRKASQDATAQIALSAKYDAQLTQFLAQAISDEDEGDLSGATTVPQTGSTTGRACTSNRLAPASNATRSTPAPEAVDAYTGLPNKVLASWFKEPIRFPPDQATSRSFRELAAPPFPLSTTRSTSSVLHYDRPVERHRITFAGQSTQGIPGQTPYFPNYEPVKLKGSQILDQYCTAEGLREVRALLATRPWDDMYFRRVLFYFLHNPTEDSEEQASYLDAQLKFQYENRQALWFLTHWLFLAKKPSARIDPAWIDLYANREELKRILRRESQALSQQAPADTVTAYLQSEPALWTEPAKPCVWALEPFGPGNSAIDQLRRLDEEEPIRCYWASQPGRFVEALLPGQLEIMDRLGGRCWELPAPWNDPSYIPFPLDQATPGTPGPDFMFRPSRNRASHI